MSLTAKLVLSPVLVAQAIATRARLPRLPEPEGQRQGVTGRGVPLKLLVTGDSSAAGVGVGRQTDALAHRLARRLAEAAHARVHWRLRARSGLTTAQTLALLRDEGHTPASLAADVAVVVTGVNDVVDQISSRRAVAAREALANWLRNGHGCQHVVFAPLPPVHHFPGLPQPLRWVAGADALRHNVALADWVQTRQDVSLVDMEMPLNPGVMASDGFHPGEPVYRYCANAIALHIAAQVWPLLHLESPA
jgi:lysophospholipase L1-like esterase